MDRAELLEQARTEATHTLDMATCEQARFDRIMKKAGGNEDRAVSLLAKEILEDAVAFSTC